MRIQWILLSVVLGACAGANDPRVDAEAASAVAVTFMQPRVSTPVVKSRLWFGREGLGKGTPLLHVLRFEGGGFVVVPADRRRTPILAWSSTGDFPWENGSARPGGLEQWMEQTLESLADETEAPESAEWADLERGRAWTRTPLDAASGLIPGGQCSPSYTETAPLVQTQWDQGCGYNNFTPPGGDGCPCGHTWAGCEATATAQIMKYWSHPRTVPFASMPPRIYEPWQTGSNEVSSFLSQLGVGLSMNYSCLGSGALTSMTVPVLRGNAYSVAGVYAYNFDGVRAELNARRPVLLDGSPSSGAGHAWVSDAWAERVNCDANGAAYYLQYLHMNWGWGSSFDGFYYSYNFNPGGRDYNSNRHMVTGIRPMSAGFLFSGESLSPGQSVLSADGRFRFTYQWDGNLVLYQGGAALWNSGTAGRSAGRTVMQPDGNLVVYDAGGRAAWWSGTNGLSGSWLAVQNDGNAVIYTRGSPFYSPWATNTCCR